MAIAIVALFVAAFLLKIVIVAAIIAALIFGGFFVYNLFSAARSIPSRSSDARASSQPIPQSVS